MRLAAFGRVIEILLHKRAVLAPPSEPAPVPEELPPPPSAPSFSPSPTLAPAPKRAKMVREAVVHSIKCDDCGTTVTTWRHFGSGEKLCISCAKRLE